MASLDDDYRLAPMLEEPPLFDYPVDLFSLDLPPLQDPSPAKTQIRDVIQADPTSPTRPRYLRIDGHAQPPAQPLSPTKDDGKGKTSNKTAVPLAEVLNVESPKSVARNLSRNRGDYARKRRKLEDTATRSEYVQLPRLAFNKTKEQQQNTIPPVLQGLHEPPPTAGLFPRITETSLDAWHKSTKEPPTIGQQAPEERDAHTSSQEDIEQTNEVVASVKTSQRSRKHESSERGRQHKAEAKQRSTPTPNTEDKAAQLKQSKSERRSQAARNRQRWTDDETSDLIKGVEEYGKGQWKKILADASLRLSKRTAIDLKDRYRVILGAGKAIEATNLANTSTLDHSSAARKQTTTAEARQLETRDSTAHSAKKQLRKRRAFTDAEDDALLKGFEQYGAAWAKITDDPELQLASRRPRDLRDRFRNRWPDKYRALGLKVPEKSEAVESPEQTTPTASQDQGDTERTAPLTGPAPVSLSRSIFEWADLGLQRPPSPVAIEQGLRFVDPMATWKPSGAST